jgi:hypothetical protein
LRSSPAWVEEGEASWYGPKFHGRRTASGEIFDATARTVAHPTLPLGAIVAIENLANGRRTVARVNDRGPYAGGRILDCSYMLADELGFIGHGTACVRVTLLDSLAPAEVFAGTGVFATAAVEDRAPVNGFAELFPTGSPGSPGFMGPPARADWGPTSATRNGSRTRTASVLPLPAILHAVRHLSRRVFKAYEGVELEFGLPKHFDRFGLRDFVRIFID